MSDAGYSIHHRSCPYEHGGACTCEPPNPSTAVQAGKYQRQLYEECVASGWDESQQNSFAEECAHLHEEISEAFRVFRLRKTFETWVDESGKPQGIPVELADVLIGLFYNAELHGFDLWQAVELKRAYNRKRNYGIEGRQLHPRPRRQPTFPGIK